MEKSERFGLVLTPAEKEVAAKLADKEGGLSMAALLRRLVREAAKAAGLWPPADSHSYQEAGDSNAN